MPAVAQHRHPVHDVRHLVEPVRDVHHADPRALQVEDHLEELRRLRLGERRRGLVHDEHFRFERQRLGDLHHLALRHRQRAHDRLRVDVHAQALQAAAGLGVQAGPVDEPAGVRLAGEEDVLGHRQVRHEVQLLVNHRDAGRFRRPRGREPHRLAVELDAALVGLQLPADDPHQRGLAGAVLAAHRMHFTAAQLEAHALQRGDRQEPLADALQGQHGRLLRRGRRMRAPLGRG